MNIFDAIVIVGDYILESDKLQIKGYHEIFIRDNFKNKGCIECEYKIREIDKDKYYDVEKAIYIPNGMLNNTLHYDVQYFNEKLTQYINENESD